ncbi:MAG: endopeptidase La [Phycisphaeraceae bacterium]
MAENTNDKPTLDEQQEGQPVGVAEPGSLDGEDDTALPEVVPVLPIREAVVFPGTITPLGVGRPASRQLLDECLPESKTIALFTQKDAEDDNPGPDDLHPVGTAVMVLKLVRQPDETVTIICHGLKRIHISEVKQIKPYMKASVESPEEIPGEGRQFDAAVAQLREQAQQLIELTANQPEQAMTVLMNIEGAGNLADFLAANLDLDTQEKQDLLEELDIAKRVRLVHRAVSNQLEMARLQHKIQEDVQSSIGDTQRKMYLREQLKAIRKELGEDGEGPEQIVEQLRERLEEADPPEKVMEEANRELERLTAVPPASPEYSVILSYLELIADLPWSKTSEDNLDLNRAQEILDRDHFDLDKVKRRLIEYLSVRKLNPDGRGVIICLVGPPGVGKTSLGQSVADALGREFSRMSLGGMRDEAEIRGHRRTYIGAMPGRIIQEIRRCGTKNPVIMLDEVDKLGSDFRGDPSSALLEVLDPRQNHQFSDRYLDVPFDLSKVMFICTANYAGNIPPPLMDRMETIQIPGYTDHDKLAIAEKYLVPRQTKENGLLKKQVNFLKAGIRKIIENYTREAGVRELERQIGSVCRAVAARVAKEEIDPGTQTKIDEEEVRKILGPEHHVRELDIKTDVPGVVVGLAYTAAGGDILFIEAAAYPGKGNVHLTGQIGEVMKESADAAFSLFKSRATELGYDADQLKELDIHIHVPAGAVPKDGPSAGVAMFTAVASLLLKKKVRSKIGMTGEITLRGKVLPIGGLNEKSLAASRAGIKTVLIPKQNERDLEEIDQRVKKSLTFIPVETVGEVLEHALGIKGSKG